MVWSSRTSKQIDKWEITWNDKCIEENDRGYNEEKLGGVLDRMDEKGF